MAGLLIVLASLAYWWGYGSSAIPDTGAITPPAQTAPATSLERPTNQATPVQESAPAAPAPARETREVRSASDDHARDAERNAQLAMRMSALVDHARQALATHRYDEAMEAADRALSIDPSSAAALDIKNQIRAQRGGS
jgi:hypothetical protein